jgi:hypothetical protein
MTKKYATTLAQIAAASLAAAPAVAAKTLQGTVKGQGMNVTYTGKAQGKKKFCVGFVSDKGTVQPESLELSVKKGGTLTLSSAPSAIKPEVCKNGKKFVKAAKKEDKVKVTASGPYLEQGKGTLK